MEVCHLQTNRWVVIEWVVDPAVDEPLSAVHIKSAHVCLYLFASPGYSAFSSLPLIQTPSALSGAA